MFLRTLEHHVFQHVGYAGHAAIFIAGANLVPDLRNHGGRTVILLNQNLQAVVQLVFMHLGFRRQTRQWGGEQQDAESA